MKSFIYYFKKLLGESIQDTVVFAYGRFNPPTTAHQMLIDKAERAAQSFNCDCVIIPSHSTKPPVKNPLNIDQKLEILSYMVTDATLSKDGSTFINALVGLQKMGYKKVIQIAGSDRQEEFEKLVSAYNNKPDRTGTIPFSFNEYKFLSSGERDPDSEGISGMSASKLRQLASSGQYKQFMQGMSANVPNDIKLQTYETLRKILAN